MATTIGYLRKKKSTEIEASPWGIQFRSDDVYPYDLLFQRMGELGIKWARFSTRWGNVEGTDGSWDWSHPDMAVDNLTSQGIHLFMNTGCASHHAYQDFPEGYYYPPTLEPKALDGYCRYAARMVEHFRDRVRHYEVWNEPNITVFWRPEPDPKAYALLLRRVSEAIRSADSQAQVIGGVLANVTPDRLEYTRAFMSEPGTADALDILSYHPYNPAPEDTLENIINLRDGARALHPGLPIWQGECGCPSSGDTIHFRGDAPWGYNVQSKWVLRRLLTDYMAGAEVSTYFLIVEFFGNLHSGSPHLRTGYNTKGLIQHDTWATKPAFYTLQNLAAAIDSSWTQVDETAEIEVVDPGIFYGIGPHEDRFPCGPWQLALRREGVPMLAYWLPWRPQEIVEPATVRVAWPAVSWKEPVSVDLISGAVSEAKLAAGAIEVPMADYPMLLTERAALDLEATPQQPSYAEIISKLRWTY